MAAPRSETALRPLCACGGRRAAPAPATARAPAPAPGDPRPCSTFHLPPRAVLKVGVNPSAAGSAYVEMGATKVMAAV